jgi:hypothetical protein
MPRGISSKGLLDFPAICLISASVAFEFMFMVNGCVLSFDWLSARATPITRPAEYFLANYFPI